MKKRGLLIVAILIMVSFMTLLSGCGENELEEELVSKLVYDMSSVTFEDATYTYDGTAKTLEIAGSLPSGVSVSYTTNTMTNAGSTVVTASFSGDSELYDAIVSMSATLTINKASVTAPTADETVFVYTGSEQTYTLAESDLYTVSGVTATNAGEHTATVSLNDQDNYAWDSGKSDDMSYAFEIEKAVYDMSGVSFEDATYTYDGTEKTLAIAGNLPSGVSVSYTTNTLTTAGSVEATASFSGDSDNYELIADQKATLEIEKAVYDMSGVSFEDATYTYDGTEKTLAIAGNLPSGVSVSYTTNTLTTAGSVEATASFSGDSDNYELIADQKATLEIEKAVYDMSGVSLIASDSANTDNAINVSLSGDLPDGVTALSLLIDTTDVEMAVLSVGFTGDSDNYELIPDKTLTLQDPTDAGYTFNGWYADKLWTSPFSEYEDIKNSDIELYAGWYTEGMQFTLNSSASAYSVSGSSGVTAASIIIPSLYGGLPVTSVGSNAFKDCVSATNVIIPANVTSIASSAFDGCSDLFDVYYGAGMDEWCTMSFADAMATPMHSASNLYMIGGSGDYYLLEGSITIDNVTSIADYAFYGCTALASLTIQGDVKNIGNYAFYGCTGVTNLTIAGNVDNIYSNAFYGCAGLVTLTIGESLLNIYEKAFQYCTSLETVYLNATNLLCKAEDLDAPFSYSGSADNGCTVIVGDNVEQIYTYLFGNFDNLTSAIIGDSVQSLASYSFYNCGNLETVTIGKSVTSVGSNAFNECTSLKDVYYNGDAESLCNMKYAYLSSTPMQYAENFYMLGESGDYYVLEDLVVPDSITSIGNYQFYCMTSLKSVTIPSSVQSISFYAFYNCTSLETVVIAEGVEEIGEYAFYGCEELKSVEIPDSVTEIKAYTFYNCSSLVDLTIGEGVTNITSYAFYGCTSLENIYYNAINATCKENVTQAPFIGTGSSENGCALTIGDNVETIGSYMFYGSYNLTSITFGSSLKSIGSNMFKNCTKLTAVTIPSTITNIGESAFSGCSNLASVTIDTVSVDDSDADDDAEKSESGTSIGNEAFYSCTSLESIEIPDGVTSIGEEAFRLCTSLTSIVVGKGIESIGADAFYSCDKLANVYYTGSMEDWACISFGATSATPMYNAKSFYMLNESGEFEVAENVELVIPSNITSIAAYQFYKFSCLTSVTIPDGVTSIGDYAFYNCTSLESVNIPDGVTSIGDYAFYYTDITSIEIPDSVKSIGEQAFYGCDNATVLTLGNSVESLGYKAFSYVNQITSWTIPASVTSIGSGMFLGCYRLTSITFEDTEGWYYTTNSSNWENKTGGTAIDVSDASAIAKELYENTSYYLYKI